MTDLRVTDLHKGFGLQGVLTGLDLVVPAGSLTAVLGPSGSGKTTLLRVLAGFERADRGTVTVGGRVVDDGAGAYVAPEHRGIGYVPQEGSLFPNLTVERNVAFGLSRGHRRDPRVQELLAMVGLTGLGRRYPHELSGGQQQRVALARALAIRPALVLLDEPFSSLDASLRQSVRDDVVAVLRAAGTTAVLVTHDQDEALSMADQVAVIAEGRVGQVDTPEGLYTRPSDPAVAGFLGEANLVRGHFAAGAVRTDFGVLAVMGPAGDAAAPPEGAEAVVLLRPEQLALVHDPAAAPLRGTVASYHYYGHDAVVRVHAPRDELVVRVTGSEPWVAGAQVGVAARGPVLAWPAAPDAPGPSGSRATA